MILQENTQLCKENSPRSEKITITMGNQIRLEADYLPNRVTKKLRERLIFDNPLYLENRKRGYSTYNIQEKLCFIKEDGNSYIIPRGFGGQLIKILKYNNVPFKIKDLTQKLPEVAFKFKGTLYDYQAESLRKILSKRCGILNIPTSGGKTVIALKVIEQRKQPTLIIVHTKELLYQWQERINEFLGIPKNEIGLIGDGHKKTGERVTVAIINSLYKFIDKVKSYPGLVIVDECHRTPSRTFTKAVKEFNSRYMLGLSATPYRRDGLTKIIYFHLGDVVHAVDIQELQKRKKVMTASLRITETGFDYPYADDYQSLISALVSDQERNEIIVKDVVNQTATDKGIALIISDRKEHCKILRSLVEAEGIETRLLTGEINNGKRKAIIEELNQGQVRVLVATGALIGEGFDFKALSSIFMTTPIKFSGRVTQYIGRIFRMAEGKNKAIIYDYKDEPGILQYSFKSRRNVYKRLGVEINEN